MSDSSPKPPQPPEMQRRFTLYPYQMIGLPLLILLPVLAILGVFGETRDTESAETPAVFLSIEYPTRVHYEATHVINITITNSSDAAFPQLTLGIDRDYLSAFSSLSAAPEFDRITAQAFEIDLQNVSPGETRIVVINMAAAEYGLHSGPASVSAAGEALARVELQTLIFP